MSAIGQQGLLYKIIDDEKLTVKCLLCAHYCVIRKDMEGACGVRHNFDGTLIAESWGFVQGLAIDPIEKKPFYNFKPGTKVLSFGTPGCNFRCLNCQNSTLSQGIKKISQTQSNPVIPPNNIIGTALDYNVDGIAYTYSEPTIFFEYARDIITACKNNESTKNLFHVFISNGFFSDELIDMIIEERLINAINIDLKFMDNKKYKKITTGSLSPVRNSIIRLHEAGIHIEIINLVIPGENDTPEDFAKISEFIASVSSDIPLHFSRFFPNYKMQFKEPTDLEVLEKAKEIAVEKGIRYVYLGNTSIPGAEDTICPLCKAILIERERFGITKVSIDNRNNESFCPGCGEKINIFI